MECMLYVMKDYEILEGEIIELLKLEKLWEVLYFLLSVLISEGEDVV